MTDFAETFDPRPISGIERERVEARFNQALKFVEEHLQSRPRPDRSPPGPRRRGRPKDDPRKQWETYDLVWRVNIKFRLKPTRNDRGNPVSACDAIAQANYAAGRTPNSFHGIKAIFLKGRKQETKSRQDVRREMLVLVAKALDQTNWQRRAIDATKSPLEGFATKSFKPLIPDHLRRTFASAILDPTLSPDGRIWLQERVAGARRGLNNSDEFLTHEDKSD